VSGYYVLVLPVHILARPEIFRQVVPIHNRAAGGGVPGDELVGAEFFQLVRFGLRSPGDPLILDSIRVADALLKTDTPSGPVWHRYNGDGYGEHDDGSPYDGTGRGRGWPLQTGERGHYELAAGRDPLPFLEAMTAMASPGGMLPEQVWDADPDPEPQTRAGTADRVGDAVVWAHAEFIKLMASRHLGHPVDRPRAVWRRYQGIRPAIRHAFWWPHAPINGFSGGARLAVALPRAALVHWSSDGWHNATDELTCDSGLGFHAASVDARCLTPAQRVVFTRQWQDTGAWYNQNYEISVLALEDA
jgi:glucoamylase